jgi:dTMP kinase
MHTSKNFIVFEGIDGSGKSTQIKLLKEYFEKKGKNNAVFTFEHTRNTEWSNKIEDVMHGVSKKIPMMDLQIMYILDRKEHIKNLIKPELDKGNIVFCDRYVLSTLAYGSLDKNISWKALWNMHDEIIGEDLIMPSKMIFFDVDPKLSVSRINKNRLEKTYFEDLEKLSTIRNAYLLIGKSFKEFQVIDGNGMPEEVLDKLKEQISEFL